MEENIASRILNKDIENIAKKAAHGKPLTDSERARIVETCGQSEFQKYAKSAVELAEILGVNRKTISRWRKHKDSPKPTSNGRYDIEKWRLFVRENNLKEKESPEETALKLRKLTAEVKQAELKLSVLESQYVSIEEVQKTWTIHNDIVQTVLNRNFLSELPSSLTKLNAIQIRETLTTLLDKSYAEISKASSEIKDTNNKDA